MNYKVITKSLSLSKLYFVNSLLYLNNIVKKIQQNESFNMIFNYVTRICRYLLMIIILSVCIIHFLFILKFDFIQGDKTIIHKLIVIDLIVVLILISIVVAKIYHIYTLRKKRIIGTRLRISILRKMITIIIIPMLTVSLFSVLFLKVGIESWFNETIIDAIDSSKQITKVYENEYYKTARRDIKTIHDFVIKNTNKVVQTPRIFQEELIKKMNVETINDIQIAFIDQKDRSFIPLISTSIKEDEKADFKKLYKKIIDDVYNNPKAQDQQNYFIQNIILVQDDKGKEYIQAYKTLKVIPNSYLVINREVPGNVGQHILKVKKGGESYDRLHTRIVSVQQDFANIFSFLIIICCLTAVWISISIADYLIAPLVTIGKQRILKEYAEKHNHHNAEEEINTICNVLQKLGSLIQEPEHSNEYNKNVIADRNNKVVNHNKENTKNNITEKRNDTYTFIQEILATMKSPIVVLNAQYKMKILNNSALHIMQELVHQKQEVLNMSITEIMPQIEQMLKQSAKDKQETISKNITVNMAGIHYKQFSVHVVYIDDLGKGEPGFILNIEDVTNIIKETYERKLTTMGTNIISNLRNPIKPTKSAISSISHLVNNELEKNPVKVQLKNHLTTVENNIHYLDKVISRFLKYTVLKEEKKQKYDIRKQISEIVSVYQRRYAKHNQVSIQLKTDIKQKVNFYGDKKLIKDMIVQLINNSIDSVLNKKELQEEYKEFTPFLVLKLSKVDNYMIIELIDNGISFPTEMKLDMFEPFTSTDKHKAGIGLAIVRKVLNLYSGDIKISVLKKGEHTYNMTEVAFKLVSS